MGNNLVVLQTKFGSFRRSKQIFSIKPECEIIDGNPPEIKTLEIQYKELNYYNYPRHKNVEWL